MQGLHLKLITANDSDMFQSRLNQFIEKLADDAMIVDIKFASSSSGNQTTFSALIQYKSVEEW